MSIPSTFIKAAETYCSSCWDAARFYGPPTQSIGAGVLLRNCPFALPAEDGVRFETAKGLVLVLTHECDIDPANDRQFNDALLVCPVRALFDYMFEAEQELGSGGWGGFLPKVVQGAVHRLMYLPPVPRVWNCPELDYGGLLYLNDMSSCLVEWLSKTETNVVCSLSAIGLRRFDVKMLNHLFRPKAERLWFDG